MTKTYGNPNSYRVATLTIGIETVANLPDKAAKEKFVFEQVALALTAQPDLLILPEGCWEYGCYDFPEQTETRESPRVRALSDLARRHGCYLAVPIFERRPEGMYNTLLLLDRQGDVVWHFDKVFLTPGELECGVRNGTQVAAYDADFGRLGAAICFDLNFPELAYLWQRQEVDLIVFSSMYRGGPMLSRWSLMTNAYIVSSTGAEGSTVIDPLGRSMGTTSAYNPFLVREIPRDYDAFHIAFNEAHWPALRSKYGSRIHLEIESQLAHFLLESRDPDLKVAELVEEFGLLTLTRALPSWREGNKANRGLFADPLSACC